MTNLSGCPTVLNRPVVDDDELSHITCCGKALCGAPMHDVHECSMDDEGDPSDGCLPCLVCEDLESAVCPLCGRR